MADKNKKELPHKIYNYTQQNKTSCQPCNKIPAEIGEELDTVCRSRRTQNNFLRKLSPAEVASLGTSNSHDTAGPSYTQPPEVTHISEQSQYLGVAMEHEYLSTSAFTESTLVDIPVVFELPTDKDIKANYVTEVEHLSTIEDINSSNPKLFGLRRLSNVGDHPWCLPNAFPCTHCGVVRFYKEPPGFCCSNGQVSISPVDVPDGLRDLFLDCKMPHHIIPVAEITPNTRNWTAKILVMRKLSPRYHQTSGKKYQRFIFIDKDETQVQATIYGADVSLMENALQLQETYFISNARVHFIEPHYQIVPNIYQWTLSKTTAICRDKTTSLAKELGAPRFTRFIDIPPLMNTKTMIDILAIVVDKLDQKNVCINPNFEASTVQDLIVVNDEKIPLRLSLWNELISSEGAAVLNTTEKMPIISATRLLVTNYKGTSLSAKGSANIIVNPPYPESQYLRTWRAKNYPFLYELVQQKKYLERSTPQLTIPHDNFSSIANVITNNTDDKFWVKVEAKITDDEQRFWYMACSNCLRSTTGEFDCKIMCNFCQVETVAKPRAKFAMTLSDNLTQLDVVMFGELAENILGFTAFELMKLTEEDKSLNCVDINKHLEHTEFIMHIKKRLTESQFGTEYRYTVISLVQPESLPMQTETEGSSSHFSGDEHSSEAKSTQV